MASEAAEHLSQQDGHYSASENGNEMGLPDLSSDQEDPHQQ